MDEFFMHEALKQARKAAAKSEVPVGCVVVLDDKIIGRGHNLRNARGNALYHAEMLAINQACKQVGDWRLDNCTIYVTTEPCPMCAGAILQARIPRLVYGTKSPKAGAAGSLINLLNDPRFNHVVHITCGILETECAALMSGFFASLRRSKEDKLWTKL